MVSLRGQILPEGKQLLLNFSEAETHTTRTQALHYFEYLHDKSPIARRVGSILIGSLEFADKKNLPLSVRLDLDEYHDFTREMSYAFWNSSRHLLDQRKTIDPILPEWLKEKEDRFIVGYTQLETTKLPSSQLASAKILDRILKETFELTETFKDYSEYEIDYDPR